MVQDAREERHRGVHPRLADVPETPLGVPGDPEASQGAHHKGAEPCRGILQGLECFWVMLRFPAVIEDGGGLRDG